MTDLDAIRAAERSPAYFCICDEEWCWCMHLVATLDTPCADCVAGKHVMEPPR
jgi:hypothetical protein